MTLVSSTADPAGIDAFDYAETPPRGALVVAGANIVYAVVLLTFARVVYAPPAHWQRPYGLLVLYVAILFWLVSPVLLITSVVSLVGDRVRSAPWIFRVLLPATVLLVLAVAAWLYLVLHGDAGYSNLLGRWDCGSSGSRSC